MEYEVYLTEQAIRQLQETFCYIRQTLQAPLAAERWAKLLEEEMASLCTMPFRFPPAEFPVHGKQELRKMVVKNFKVYYRVKEAEKQVWIVAVLYARRDQIAALTELDFDTDALETSYKTEFLNSARNSEMDSAVGDALSIKEFN